MDNMAETTDNSWTYFAFLKANHEYGSLGDILMLYLNLTSVLFVEVSKRCPCVNTPTEQAVIGSIYTRTSTLWGVIISCQSSCIRRTYVPNWVVECSCIIHNNTLFLISVHTGDLSYSWLNQSHYFPVLLFAFRVMLSPDKPEKTHENIARE